MGNVNKASKKDSKRKKVRKNSTIEEIQFNNKFNKPEGNL